MPLDPAGNASLIPSYFAEPGTTIRTEQHNPVLEDIANMLSAHLVRDGRNGMVGPLDMGTFLIRNLAPGVNPTDAATVSQGVPVGALMDYAGTNAPSGWMLCYGQAVSRTTYAALFTAIGTTYGAGDGSTSFNLPDLRGRVIAGKDNMGGTSADRLTGAVNGDILGAHGGSETHVLTVAQMPPHDHGGLTSVAGSHTHTPSGFFITGGGSSVGVFGNGTRTDSSNQIFPAGDHQHSIPSQGSGHGHNNIQPTIVLNKIIKVSI